MQLKHVGALLRLSYFPLAFALACAGDASNGDAGPDARADGGMDASLDGTTDADASIVTNYHDMTDVSFWQTYDLVANVDPNANGFNGAVFDGKYVYLVPGSYMGVLHGLIVRYDTRAPFQNASSWSKVDISQQMNALLKGFGGGLFDGRYVYLVPYLRTNTSYSSLIGRYDTLSGFSSTSAWSVFDIATVDTNAVGFFSGAFDGQYLYLAAINANGRAMRYDTQAAFDQKGSWTAFDSAQVDPSARGYAAIGFDGQYLYYSPYFNGTSPSGLVARHDTQQAFDAGWSVFDATTIDAGATAYNGAIFDGQYVYFVPNGPTSGLVLRYDAKSPFGQADSWTTFDMATKNAAAKTLSGGQFDGRYVYFTPTTGGVVVRYDSRGTFGSPDAWQAVDVSGLDANATNFGGSAFDGRYVYFSNHATGTIARFDVKSPPSLPPKPQGSFF